VVESAREHESSVAFGKNADIPTTIDTAVALNGAGACQKRSSCFKAGHPSATTDDVKNGIDILVT
jgi:hypothetical protein